MKNENQTVRNLTFFILHFSFARPSAEWISSSLSSAIS
jgi:hypothetical protein